MVELRRRFAGKPQLISEMRDFVRNGCLQIWNDSSDDFAISRLELAVSEAASNIILHGIQGQENAPIELAVSIDTQKASVTFLYSGCAFKPHSVPPPDFAGRAESGYGLFLIQQSVDDVQFSRDDAAGICVIRFVKNRVECAQE